MGKLKNYAIKEKQTKRIVEETIPTNVFLVEGNASVIFWGGGKGVVEMTPTTFKSEVLTKEVIRENLNDGGFVIKYWVEMYLLVKELKF